MPEGAIIELVQIAVRQSECAAITLFDVQLLARVSRDAGDVGSLRLLGKGRKERTITLNSKVCRALKAYLAVRPKVGEEALFLTRFEKPLGTRWIRNIVAKYLAEASIPAATAHALRHTFAPRAWELLKRALEIDIALYGPDHLAFGYEYNNLGQVLFDRGYPVNAITELVPR